MKTTHVIVVNGIHYEKIPQSNDLGCRNCDLKGKCVDLPEIYCLDEEVIFMKLNDYKPSRKSNEPRRAEVVANVVMFFAVIAACVYLVLLAIDNMPPSVDELNGSIKPGPVNSAYLERSGDNR